MSLASYIIENDQNFREQLDRLGKLTQDFRIPFGLISQDFYKSEQMIFQLKGPGLYPDLAPSTKKQKEKRIPGSTYPILVGATGRLAFSLLNPKSRDAINIIGKTSLTIGSTVPYLKYHQSDLPRTRLPQRKALFIDGGPLETSKGGKNGRRERWTSIIEDYISKILAGEIK